MLGGRSPDAESGVGVRDQFPELRPCGEWDEEGWGGEASPLQAMECRREGGWTRWLQTPPLCSPRTVRNRWRVCSGVTQRGLGEGHLACECTVQPSAPVGRACAVLFYSAVPARGAGVLFHAYPVRLCAALGLLAVTWGRSPRDRAPVCELSGCGGNGSRGSGQKPTEPFPSFLAFILTEGSTVLWHGFKVQKSL